MLPNIRPFKILSEDAIDAMRLSVTPPLSSRHLARTYLHFQSVPHKKKADGMASSIPLFSDGFTAYNLLSVPLISLYSYPLHWPRNKMRDLIALPPSSRLLSIFQRILQQPCVTQHPMQPGNLELQVVCRLFRSAMSLLARAPAGTLVKAVVPRLLMF
jgi:hypothetical protein